jgi:DNA-binding transcriptional MerR regulator
VSKVNMVNQPGLEAASDEPLYNIGMVSRMTGIPVATLRIWERRYGFPHSVRTAGGHRLSSEREVMRLRWVKARIDEGMQTAQAIHALQHLEQSGQLTEAPLVTPASYASVADPSLNVFQEHLSNYLMSHDLPRADQLLGEVLALYPLEDLILGVVAPALETIGQAWHDGKINVATEHLASNFLRQHLLIWMATGPQPYHGVMPVILACAPGEWHEASLLILGVLLRRRRWPVAYLGQNVPVKDLGESLKQFKAPAVVFVAMTEETARHLLDWPQYFPPPDASGRPIVGFGGPVFNYNPELREQMPGMFLGETLREGVERLDDMLLRVVKPVL